MWELLEGYRRSYGQGAASAQSARGDRESYRTSVLHPRVRISHPCLKRHLGPNNPFSWRRCLVRCTRLAASLAATCYMPETPPDPSCDKKSLWTVSDDPWGTELPTIEKHLKSLPWTCVIYIILMAFKKKIKFTQRS